MLGRSSAVGVAQDTPLLSFLASVANSLPIALNTHSRGPSNEGKFVIVSETCRETKWCKSPRHDLVRWSYTTAFELVKFIKMSTNFIYIHSPIRSLVDATWIDRQYCGAATIFVFYPLLRIFVRIPTISLQRALGFKWTPSAMRIPRTQTLSATLVLVTVLNQNFRNLQRGTDSITMKGL